MFLRTDIPLAQQLVQASHAALEAGLKDNHTYQQTSSIIIFQIPDEETQHSNGNPFGFDPDGLFNFPEPKNPLDDLGSLPDTVTSVNEQMNKICIATRGFKIFNGKKW